MQYSYALFALVATVAAVPHALVRRAINPILVPDFGVTAGVPSTTQPGSCQGLNGVNIKCTCPPPRQQFLAKLNQFVGQGTAGKSGEPISFPEGNDPASIALQNHALIITMQNFDDTVKGEGCPAAAAVFKEGTTPSGDAGHATAA